MKSKKKNIIETEDWDILDSELRQNNLFSTYNLLGKRRFPKTQFFEHPCSPGEYPGKSISVCIDLFGDTWEIYLFPDGTWKLI